MPEDGARRSVGIVGLGHIGASAALALAGSHRLAVWDPNPEAAAFVRERRPEVVVDLDAVCTAEVVLVAAPTPEVPEILGEFGRRRVAGLVLDVASVKTGLWRSAPRGVRHLSVHPMAGREGAGAASADPEIFVGATWAFVLDGEEPDEDVATAIEFVIGSLGAGAIVGLEPSAHDEVLAVVSHLPHLLAAAVARTLAHADGPQRWWLGSGSLRDATRVARSRPDRVAEMLQPNRSALRAAVASLVKELEVLKGFLDDPVALVAALREAHDAAARVVARPGDAVEVDVDGSLARELLRRSALGEGVTGFQPPRRLRVARWGR